MSVPTRALVWLMPLLAGGILLSPPSRAQTHIANTKHNLTASGPGRRRIQATRVAVRFQAASTASEAADTATVGKWTVCAAPSSASILPKNSPGILSIDSPRKSLICEMKITTAIPLVKPITTDTGMKRIMLPRRKAPIASSIIPDIIVAISRFWTP